VKSNAATDLPPDQRLTDDDILHNINTFLFAGSDTTSLALTWTLFLLAQRPEVQDRLRAEIIGLTSGTPFGSASILTEEELASLHTAIADLPLLDNVCRESLRLIPPVHSSLRVATRDDVVPTSSPVLRRARNGALVDSGARSVHIPKGTFVHVPVEAFNLDKDIWGPDAWEFK
jgi:cytochrome P450